MGWGDDILRSLDGKPFYDKARRKNQKLDAAITAATKSSLPAGNKFHAKQTIIDGIRFDSKLEAERWQYLYRYKPALARTSGFDIRFTPASEDNF